MSQNTKDQDKNDGFPLMIVLNDMISRLSRLLMELPLGQRSKDLRYEVIIWKQWQREFEDNSNRLFKGNLLQTFNEYLFHFIVNFMLAWRGGIAKM
jgi:hypothetical protein